MRIDEYFMRGDLKGAMEYMRAHEEFADFLPLYVARFENCEYASYELPENLNRILLAYQVYYRDVFYCKMPESEAARKLLAQLGELLGLPDADDSALAERMTELFREQGYHTQFGDTQGFYGPYIWKETVPTVYHVELPDGAADYTVNILRGFIMRSWMDYLTFGMHGTGGWASKDGTINCVESAYDFESEKFLVNLLKHEAQHTVDMKRFPGIGAADLEYRAKLVELCYSADPKLLGKFIETADESKQNDGHAIASVRIKNGFAALDSADIAAIRARALELFRQSNAEMNDRYGLR